MIPRRFYLVRHGDAEFSLNDKERVLTTLGKKQAQAIGVLLAQVLRTNQDIELGNGQDNKFKVKGSSINS